MSKELQPLTGGTGWHVLTLLSSSLRPPGEGVSNSDHCHHCVHVTDGQPKTRSKIGSLRKELQRKVLTFQTSVLVLHKRTSSASTSLFNPERSQGPQRY